MWISVCESDANFEIETRTSLCWVALFNVGLTSPRVWRSWRDVVHF